ncbi:TM0106 family RecB-like putative nuclease [Georgenia sp. MJ170]|uniref:TM0106 family RecB-like putative nuclease n=1 Tax=Georgenia sunbinii TaxID=3117728 RepID=UPI002F264935
MFLLDDGVIVYSASDLAAAAACEFALLRVLDGKLGRAEPVALAGDAMLERAARLGDQHEARVLAGLEAQHGPWDTASGRGVARIERPAGRADRALLEAKREETLEVLRTGADVVFQAGFFDGRFAGWADFVIREPDGRYGVYDTKLARRVKVTALLQLAGYADQLQASGVALSAEVHLWLGDASLTSHRLDDVLPVYRVRRARLEEVLDTHQAGGATVDWGDPRYSACLRCELCEPELLARRDVLLVAGLRTTQRARLQRAGVTTVDALATGSEPVDGIGSATLTKLRAQARLQVAQQGDQVRFEVHTPQAIAALPPASAGDVFFDFEGDPLWTERPGDDDWGLEYLFGLVEAPVDGAEPRFRAFWAHDRVAEKQALVDFLVYVDERRARYPDMHVYHYAPYERSALLRLAGRHGVGESAVDRLLREGVLVDLYATVRQSLRTGQDSASLKKLEPLYMPQAREGEVVTAGESIVEYAEACAERDAGRLEEWQRRIDAITDYNREDCVSTLRLRDWLVTQATALGFPPGPAVLPSATPVDDDAPDGDELAASLLGFADSHASPAGRDADRQAVAMVAAALDYHWREAKPFWWAHFDRLATDPAEWADARDTLLVEEAEVVVDWAVPPGKRAAYRSVRVVGRLDPGSDLTPGSARWLLYEPPLPAGAKSSVNGHRGWSTRAAIGGVDRLPDGRVAALVAESAPVGEAGQTSLPTALIPAAGPDTRGLKAAITGLASHLQAGLPQLPQQPALDLLRRRPPRLRDGGVLPQPTSPTGYAEAITAAILELDGSYIAVQGPPGTGKTYVGAHVIAALVERGWRIGVVAQSHAVVENMLGATAAAGVARTAVGKKPSAGTAADPDAPWTWLPENRFAGFFATNPGGYVLGGTAWDFVNANRLPAEPLDLLVIDEAGQFSLANTLAVSTAARNLLLLGDPQQLPQVSQGRHPEPVDRSALGWLTDGHDTLPPERGYFLERSWRMHPELCAAVSRLSYERRLTSMPHTADRSLDGVTPGVRTVLVAHEGNAVASVEEAREVVTQVRDVVGRRWRDPSADVDRSLTAADVLVVAAYNAQVGAIRAELSAAGLDAVPVGTVDKFQGQQAPVVIVSMAASSAQDVPRGMDFLLNRNRVNVAVSRGQWCAVIVRGNALTDYLPAGPGQLVELGAFLGLG